MAAVPDAVVGFLLENLKDFVVANADLIAGSKDKVNQLCDQLELLKDFLKKCTEQRYSDDDFLAGLAKKVRRLVYKAEDTIETYIATVSKQKFRSTVGSALHAIDHVVELRNIGKELAALKQEVQSFYQQEVDKGLKVVIQEVDEDKAKHYGVSVRKHPVEVDMVGFKDAVEDVMKYLKDGPDDLQTVSIVGMFGLGKTTLARHVFNHPDVEYQFAIRAFVEVSQDFKRKEVLFKLVRVFRNVSSENMNKMDEFELQEEIKSYLDKRNYLIVLDDVWDRDAWDQLKACFPNNEKKSRVLITTRVRPVAEHAKLGLGFEPYLLRFLTDQESRELLRKKVFGKTDTIKADLEVHEKAILDRCDGLPFAIVVVAGILTKHREETFWWADVSKKVETYNLAKEADHAINLSFNQLPFRLKPCFLYLGVFPEDSEILSKTLYQLWVSEGFVPQDHANETCEDKAKSYLEQLADKSLVMVTKRGFNGQIKTIRIHDMLREFCKMQGVVERLFREIQRGYEYGEMSTDNDRRLCINSRVQEYTRSRDKRAGKFVRSFLSFAKEDIILPLELISDVLRGFKLLRVLDIRSIRFTRFPVELFYSFLLKYIAMYSDLKTIPEKVSNLRYLQTLIFKTTQRSIEIKADIWKMKQLRHLETNASTKLPKTKEALSVNENLQSLSAISPESCTPEVFKRSQKIKKLSICGELAPFVDTLFPTLSELGCLENLKLLNANTTVPLKSLPFHTSYLHKLTKLTLLNTMLSWEWMATLTKLKKLEVLKLKDNAFLGPNWDAESTGGFGSLKVLHIGSTDLITWKASKGRFPQLTHLYLRECSKLGDIPSDLVNVSTLQLIDIHRCNPEVANSARKLVFAKHHMEANERSDQSNQLKLFVYPPDQ